MALFTNDLIGNKITKQNNVCVVTFNLSETTRTKTTYATTTTDMGTFYWWGIFNG